MLLAFCLVVTVVLIILIFLLSDGVKSDVIVVCIGEIERSPRTLYHVDCLLSAGKKVKLICFNKNKCFVSSRWEIFKDITIINMYDVDILLAGFPRKVALVAKLLLQSMLLFKALCHCGSFQVMLIQNPPSVPTLGVCVLYKFLSRSKKLIIDWHNFGYTILYSTTKSRILSRFYEWFEFFFGKFADLNLTVTHGMKIFLEKRGFKHCIILRDMPAEKYKPITEQERQCFLEHFYSFILKHEDAKIEYESGSSILIMSSTSWTEDEDFEILLEGLKDYDFKTRNSDYPVIHCVITGKGKQRKYYEEKVNSMTLERVRIFMLWLSFDDYAKLLASSTLGVCLHTSSSGYDFPMKVIDMLGCKLPICAFEFQCLKEVLFDKVNSFYFTNKNDLCRIFCENLVKAETGKYESLDKIKETLNETQFPSFAEEWRRVLLPLIS